MPSQRINLRLDYGRSNTGAGSQTGMGDTFQSLFFSPKAPTSGGLI
jgi:hypothetical protein